MGTHHWYTRGTWLTGLILFLFACAGGPALAAGTGTGASDPGYRKCVRCHDEEAEHPVLSILKTKHAVVADERTPMSNHACVACHGPSEAHMDQEDAPPDVTFHEADARVGNEVCQTCHMGKHLTEKPESIRAQRPEVSAEMEQIIMRCLAKHPDQRYRDARDLEAALCEAQISAGLHTAWDDLPLPDVEPERRAMLASKMPRLADAPAGKRRWLWPLIAVVGMAAAATIAIILTREEPPEPGEEEIVKERERLAIDAGSRGNWVYPEDPEQPEDTETDPPVDDTGSPQDTGTGPSGPPSAAEIAGETGGFACATVEVGGWLSGALVLGLVFARRR